MKDTANLPPTRSPGDTLQKQDVSDMIARYKAVRDDSFMALDSRNRLNDSARACRWPNQNEEGTKTKSPNGGDPFPWKGASDVRLPLVDTVASEDAAMLALAATTATPNVVPVSPDAIGQAAAVRHLIQWMKTVHMPELMSELTLLANYVVETGKGVMAVTWVQRTRHGYDTLTLDHLAQLSQAQAQHGGAAPLDLAVQRLPALVADPTLEEAAIAAIAELYPEVGDKRLRGIVRDLRDTGSARFPRPYLHENRPMAVALCPGLDIFFPVGCANPEDATVAFRVEYMDPNDLRAMVTVNKWDEEWAQKAMATASTSYGDLKSGQRRRPRNTSTRSEPTVEIVHVYERTVDEDGVEGVYYTCLCPAVSEAVAYHGLLNYDHGRLPFVAFAIERTHREYHQSRGAGERTNTIQRTLKSLTDQLIDRSSVTILPPLLYTGTKAPDQVGPGVRIAVDEADQLSYLASPSADGAPGTVLNVLMDIHQRYCGRPAANGANQLQAMQLQQAKVNMFLDSLARVDRMILQLCQQFLPPKVTIAVLGPSTQQAPIQIEREQIQGQFYIAVTQDLRMMDHAYVEQFVKLLGQLMSFDTGGRLNRDALLELCVGTLLPQYTGLLRAPQDAAMSEIEDLDATFAKIFSGIGQDIKPGQAYELRLQRLKDIITKSPTVQARLQADPQFKQDVERYGQQLDQQLQQQQNAVTGRLGAPSANTPQA
jgi:hypothetical protein